MVLTPCSSKALSCLKEAAWGVSVENQDFPHGNFVLTPKFAVLRQNGDLYE